MENRIKNHRYTSILEHYRTFNNAYKQVIGHLKNQLSNNDRKNKKYRRRI